MGGGTRTRNGDAATSPSPRPRVVLVDARSPNEFPLRELVEGLSATHEVVVAGGVWDASVVASAPAEAVLIHAGLEPRPNLPACGPSVAALVRNGRPGQPMALYTGAPSASLALQLARGGLATPLVRDRRLVSASAAFVRDLVAHARAVEPLGRCGGVVASPAAGDPPRIHAGFRVDAFHDKVELAFTRAAIREHPDYRKVTAAIDVPLDTLKRRLRLHCLESPRGGRPDSFGSRRLLWCSNRPPPSSVEAACDAADLSVKQVPPGSLHHVSLLSPVTTAALVEIVDEGSVFDAWLASRCVKPFILFGSPSVPVRILLEALHLAVSYPGLPEQLVPAIIEAGDRAASLYQDDPLRERLVYCHDAKPAWPIPWEWLREVLDQHILWYAEDTEPPPQQNAADVVGLELRTFQRRLRRDRPRLDVFDRERQAPASASEGGRSGRPAQPDPSRCNLRL